MNFRNDTDNTIMVALPNLEQPHAPNWKAVEPDSTIDCPESIGKAYGLTEIKALKSKVATKTVETKKIKSKKK